MTFPARAWREFPQRYRLEASQCAGCSKVLYPPRVKCPACGGREFTTIVLPKTGRILTFTIVRVPPAGFTEQTPLPIALVELENGIRLMVQIGDVENPRDLRIGMRVRLEFRRVSWDGEAGVILYGHKAVPDL
jgi:uncharacterized OB-fold protein